MVVNSKFKIGDIIWYISNNKVQQGKITAVDINVNEYLQREIKYTLSFDFEIDENEVYGSKAELLETL